MCCPLPSPTLTWNSLMWGTKEWSWVADQAALGARASASLTAGAGPFVPMVMGGGAPAPAARAAPCASTLT